MLKMSFDAGTVRYTLNGETMGTRYAVVFHAAPALDTGPLTAALFAAVDRVDRQMSTWKPDSDLNRLNAAPVGTWVPVPVELLNVLDAARLIGQRSGGSFDIGVGAQVTAWGFGAHAGRVQTHGLLQQQPSDRLGPVVECDRWRGMARRCAAVSLDLSGIAKGFGVDELARVLDRFMVTSWLVGIDGELRARGQKPDGLPWMIAHERPVPGIREAMGGIELNDRAVATSGIYRHFRNEGRRMLSHTIDPHSGQPTDGRVAAVTVLAGTCMEADAWATAFLVMGPQRALPLANVMGLDAIMVMADGSVRATL